jgi:hypothetical protein
MPETEKILRDNWEKLTYQQIANRINDHLRKLYSHKYKSWNVTSVGGVLFAASRIGLISKVEELEIRKELDREKRRKRRLRSVVGAVVLYSSSTGEAKIVEITD